MDPNGVRLVVGENAQLAHHQDRFLGWTKRFESLVPTSSGEASHSGSVEATESGSAGEA